MLALLPVLFFLLTGFAFWRSWGGLRRAFLASALVWGAWVGLLNEALSLLGWLSAAALAAAWAAAAAAAGWLAWKRRGKAGPPMLHLEAGWLERGQVLGLFLIVALVGVTAWTAPPNNFDSMTYHLSRVAHWAQNQSLAFYPTHILRQLHYAPGAEYLILQFQILSGGDRFANLVQWFSLVGSLLGVSLLAQTLGANRRGQLGAAIACATLPMGILQGSSTQTDYVTAFWLVNLVYWGMALMQPEAGWETALAAGAALGLAVLTKATAYIYALPFALWIGFRLLRRRGRGVRLGIVMVGCVLLLNAGHLLRNQQLFHSPLGPAEEAAGVTNQTFSLPAIGSNLARNLALHIGTPFPAVNRRLEAGIQALHAGLGISADDPRTTFAGVAFQVGQLSNHEDYAGNPLQLGLIGLAALGVRLHPGASRASRLYLLACAAGGLFFCASLKWQPWNSRLHLPLFVLASPLVGYALALAAERVKTRRIIDLLLLAVLISAAPWALRNRLRPLMGENSIFRSSRAEAYFNNQPQLRQPYLQAAQALQDLGCQRVGLILGADDWEYPLWALTARSGPDQIIFEHVDVTNISGRTTGAAPPCAILKTGGNLPPALALSGRDYAKAWEAAPVAIYAARQP